MMDVTRYVNSKDIQKYLKDINYQFNAAEAAWLVFHSRELSFEKRKNAWEKIIKTMSNFTFDNKHPLAKFSNAKVMLKDYIKLIEKSIKVLKGNKKGTIYKIFIIDKYGNEVKDANVIFSSYENAYRYLNNHYVNDKNMINVKFIYVNGNKIPAYNFMISKSKLDKIDADGAIDINYKGEIESAFINEKLLNKYELSLQQCFKNMFFDFPLPFKKGDILIDPYNGDGQFVLEDVKNKENESEKIKKSVFNMSAYGYFADFSTKMIYHKCIYNYMNLEFNKEKLTGHNEFLLYLSNFLKGNIRFDEVVTKYQQIML